MKVLVLGCGPAGLLAAWGALAHPGVNVVIASQKRVSPLYGAQYLHSNIPGITRDPVQVQYILRGNSFDYRQKVYGPVWDGKVSPEDLEETHLAWDIRAAYKVLWRILEPSIDHVDLKPAVLRALMVQEPYDLIINSIPRNRLCYNPQHVFGSTDIVAAGDAPDLGIRLAYSCPPNTIICNGEDNPAWYRMSRVFGHTTVEWPGSIDVVPVATAGRWLKPTYTDCDCWPEVMHVGRYGTWTKGVLSHEAFFNTYKKVGEIRSAAAEAEA